MKTIYAWSTKKFKRLLQEKLFEIDKKVLTDEIKDWMKSRAVLDECDSYDDYQQLRYEFGIKYEFSKIEFLASKHPYIE